jgi:hypothetical protein
MKFETNLHAMPLSSCVLMTPSATKGILYLRIHMKFCTCFCKLIWIKFRIGNIHKIALTDCDFSENWCCESKNLLRGINRFVTTISTCILQFEKNWYKRSTYFGILEFHAIGAERLYFLYGWIINNICVDAVKPRDFESRGCLSKAHLLCHRGGCIHSSSNHGLEVCLQTVTIDSLIFQVLGYVLTYWITDTFFHIKTQMLWNLACQTSSLWVTLSWALE